MFLFRFLHFFSVVFLYSLYYLFFHFYRLQRVCTELAHEKSGHQSASTVPRPSSHLGTQNTRGDLFPVVTGLFALSNLEKYRFLPIQIYRRFCTACVYRYKNRVFSAIFRWKSSVFLSWSPVGKFAVAAWSWGEYA